ncbi:MAG: hypothetical protein ACYTBS_17210 [Planctomycetota bacterium]|jgi:hypothetical protein
MERSVHDHLLESYTVDCRRRRVILRTRPHHDGESEQTDVVFFEVAAYHFQDDCFGNILLEIDETDSVGIVDDHKAMFDSGRRYGWPGPWNTTHEAAVEYVRENDLSGFTVCASLGFNGWVLARGVEVKVRTAG